MHWKVLLILFLVDLAYLLLGALGFHYIERPTEESLHTDLKSLAASFLAQHSCLDAKNFTIFLARIMNAYKAGYSLGENGTVIAPAPKWDYPSSVFFSMTVMTTIGYGNLAPSTPAGQAFCCVFALIGIPLLAILLSGIAERVKSVRERVQRCGCWSSRPRVAETVSSALYFLLGLLFFLVIPAGVFCVIEGWRYAEGLYYSFITLSTIGFGDYVAGQTVTSTIYKLSLSLWIYLGLVFLSGVISTLQGLIEDGAKRAEAKIEGEKNLPVDKAGPAFEELHCVDVGRDETMLEVLPEKTVQAC